jgi:glycyl-tRNA synthetase
MKLHKDLAPIKAAVFPLLANRPDIVELAKNLTAELRPVFPTAYDDTASIGRLYRRQDEIGTLYCITVDVQSLEDKQVTIRDRDTMEQIRVPIEKVKEILKEKL